MLQGEEHPVVHDLTASFLELNSIRSMMETSKFLCDTWVPFINHLCLPSDYNQFEEGEEDQSMELFKRVLARRKGLTSITSTSGKYTYLLWKALAGLDPPPKLQSLDVTINHNPQLNGARDVRLLSLKSLTARFAVTEMYYPFAEDPPWIENLYPIFESGMCNNLKKFHLGSSFRDVVPGLYRPQKAISNWLCKTRAPELRVLAFTRTRDVLCRPLLIQTLYDGTTASNIQHLELGNVDNDALPDLAQLSQSRKLLVFEAYILDPHPEHLGSFIQGLAPNIQRMSFSLDHYVDFPEAATRAAFQHVVFPALVDLTLEGAWITDEVVVNMPYLANLHRLHLKHTHIYDWNALAIALQGAAELPLRDFSVDVKSDQNKGALVRELGRATNLERLLLDGRGYIHAADLASVSWPRLRCLDLCGYTVEILNRLVTNNMLHHLQEVCLSDKGDLLRVLGLATNLESLKLQCTFTAADVANVSWPRLRTLSLSHFRKLHPSFWWSFW